MNKKLRALLDSINAKKQEVQDLAEAGKLTEAQTAKDELQQLQKKFDLLADVMDAHKNNAGACCRLCVISVMGKQFAAGI